MNEGQMCKPLVVAYYLPQFYPVGLNSTWWGEGFTEWNSLVKSQRGWRSPSDTLITPGELGFYDLRSRDTRERQGALAKEYGVDAFAVYHYYSAGKRVLDEVVDAMLEDGAPNHPFFFCWANHDWTLAWQGRPEVVTWAQEYDEGVSDEHVDWLLSAFSDDRYLKLDGRPVLQIYDVSSIPEASSILKGWRDRARSAGFPDLYIMAVVHGPMSRAASEVGVDAWVQAAGPALKRVSKPRRLYSALRSFRSIARLVSFRDTRLERRDLAEALVLDRADSPHPLEPMLMATWNNVGRRSERAWYLEASPSVFESELTAVLVEANGRCARGDGPGFVFINAWNEWGEGMALEPSVEHGRAFLQAIWNSRDRSSAQG